MYKRLFNIWALILLASYVSAQIYKDECTTRTKYVYGGYAGCYASIPVPNWPTVYIDGTFPDQDFSSTIQIRREVSDKCIGVAPCPSFVYSCLASLPYKGATTEVTCAKKLIDPNICSILPQERYDGGHANISADQCKAREMCWDNSSAGTNWCYIPKGKCNVAPSSRVDGGWRGITQSQCLNAGMCWNDSVPHTNWCYRPNPF